MKFKKEKAAILILSVIAVAGLTVAGIGIVNHLFPDAIDFTPEPEILSPQITGEFSYGQIPEVRKYESGLLKSSPLLPVVRFRNLKQIAQQSSFSNISRIACATAAPIFLCPSSSRCRQSMGEREAISPPSRKATPRERATFR